MKEFFKVENLCYAYLKKPLCLKDVSFSAAKSENVLILGLDDKGKSTLLKTISGFDDKFFGKVFLNSQEIRTIADTDKNFSLIFDYPVLLNSTIDKDLNFVYDAIGKNYPTDEEKLALLKKFNLNHSLNEKTKKLSNYEKFMLCLLRVFIKKSRVLLVDDIFKYNFSDEECAGLATVLGELSRDRLMFFVANEKTFKTNRRIFEGLKPTKVLYLNFARVMEFESIEKFINNPVDLDACEFSCDFEQKEGFCVFQEGSYYVSIEEIVVKVDKNLNNNFDKLNLSDGENEDIVLVYKKGLNPDLTKNNDINKLMLRKDIMVFSKLDRSKVN